MSLTLLGFSRILGYKVCISRATFPSLAFPYSPLRVSLWLWELLFVGKESLQVWHRRSCHKLNSDWDHSARQAFQITPKEQEKKPQTKPKYKLKDRIWLLFRQVWTQLKDPEGADSRILPSVLTPCKWTYAMVPCLAWIFYNIQFTQRAIIKT